MFAVFSGERLTQFLHLKKIRPGTALMMVPFTLLSMSVITLVNLLSQFFVDNTAAAMMEAYCNEVCESLSKEYRERGLFLHPRFSPGYGDFPLSCQPGILDALEAGKRIGIKLTEGFLMLPSKS